MRRALCVLLLAACALLFPTVGLPAEKNVPRREKPAEKVEPTGEDRKVLGMLELLQLMDLLEDMELLEGKPKTVSEEKR